jgi:hypothetical protein
LDRAMDPELHLRALDHAFRRVFGEAGPRRPG